MDELQKLYSGSGSKHPQCEGCSILKQSKSYHCKLDHKDVNRTYDILFLSDCFHQRYDATPIPFREDEFDLIQEMLPTEYKDNTYFSPSVKCPIVGEDDMSPTNMNICRKHLYQTLLSVRPKLVFACGNLSLKMITKKSGVDLKRGTPYLFEHEDFQCKVVPVIHPYLVLLYPGKRYLFEIDIRNSIARIIEGRATSDFSYETIDTEEKLKTLEHLFDTDTPVACDIETTGLDFNRDKIQTIAFSHESGTYTIPIHHKDTPEEMQGGFVIRAISNILSNPNNIKVFHNAKFDLKFLYRYAVEAVNVWDTKVMQHLINENVPKSLNDLVNMYFPEELEEDTTC